MNRIADSLAGTRVLPESARRITPWRLHACAVLAAAVATGAAWVAVVPPFEGSDELFFYKEARRLAEQPEYRENLFYRLAAPVIRAMPSASAPAEPRSNPAFQFISNRHGEVNRWTHDRPSGGREHARVLVGLRLLVVLIAATTALMFAAMAWLCLPDRRLQWIVVGLCLWIPQASFMHAVVQREVITEWLGAAVALVVVARATDRLNRWSAWALLLALIALVPLADRQAYFLVPFAVVSLVATERTWRHRVMAAMAIVAPAMGAAWLVTHGIEAGTNLYPWVRILRDPLRPFTAGTGGAAPPGAGYYAFEFFPKLFMGFWGWMGQPSLLLPAWVYGGLAALCAVSTTGLVLGFLDERAATRTDNDRQRRRARRLLAVGVVLMCGPIVYGPVIAGRDLWYGHWLFPMLGPIAVGFVLGLTTIVRLARLYPHRVAFALATVSLLAAALWLSGPGETLRAAVIANHYGDGGRLVNSIRDTILALAVMAAALEVSAYARRWSLPVPTTAMVAGVMAALNACLLVAFVRPLYAAVSPAEYAGLVARYTATRDLARAADIYASALKSYPDSPELSDLGDASPRLLLGGDPNEMSGLLERHLARGGGLRDRDALLALATRLRDSNAKGSEALNAAVADAERDPELGEAAALVRIELHRGTRTAPDAVAPIEVGHGRRLMTRIRNEMLLEGYTTHPLPEGTQVILYLRPTADAQSKRIWLHAYPVGSGDYLTIAPTIPPGVWRPGQLVWAVFELPNGRFNVFVGMWVGTDIGPASAIGEVP
jgi:hypothetical protein